MAVAAYAQQILAGFWDLPFNNTLSSSTNVSESMTHDTLRPLAVENLSGLFALLFSFSALRDWIKLIVIGGFLETCRRFLFSTYVGLVSSFYINAYFEEDDPSYEWLMVWLSKQPSWRKSRDVQISTHTYGANSSAVMLEGEENQKSSKSSRRLSYLPSLSITYYLWYKRRYMSITRTQEQTGWYGQKERTLHISILTRSHDLLVQLLQEARSDYMAAQEHNMCVYVSDSGNNWRHVACRAKRSMRSIVLDPGIKEMLLEDAHDFLKSKPWYSERGIPFRRGYLLYGAPGSGKTSLIHSLAGELGLDVYVISLSRIGLDDAALDELVNQLPERCIALMEDIDAAFTHGVTRSTSTVETSTPGELTNIQAPKSDVSGGSAPPPPTSSRLSLSGLLNALDGVGAQEGRILFATTNKYSSLDPALCRPGRMDLHIEFNLASRYQAKELFVRFFNPTENPEEESDDKEEEESSESLGSSVNGEAEERGATAESTSEQSIVLGNQHIKRPPKLSRHRLDELASRFAEAIPQRELSMASLQGYLMAYKIRPLEAVEDVVEWVTKQKEDLAKKEKPALIEAEKKEATPEQKKKEEEKEKTEKDQTERDIEERVQKEVQKRFEREKMERDIRRKIEADMTVKMEKLIAETLRGEQGNVKDIPQVAA